MHHEWGLEPPIAPFVAAYFGYKPPTTAETPVNAIEMFQLFPTGNINLDEIAPELPQSRF